MGSTTLQKVIYLFILIQILLQEHLLTEQVVGGSFHRPDQSGAVVAQWEHKPTGPGSTPGSIEKTQTFYCRPNQTNLNF